jgi:cobalt/nickel transport system permease protein
MHVPDGFLDVPTSIATGVVAAGAIAVALRGARRELDDKTTPLAGITAAFIFAAQMLNFPVGAGTSGHLIGAGLAAVLVGPWTAMLVMSVVLIVQALLFADGGVTALGTNLVLMAVVATGVAWLVVRGVQRCAPSSRRLGVPAAALAGLVSVPVAAAVFSALFAIGGTADIAPATVLTAMIGWHTLIGVGEAVITALVVSAIMAVRPDLVYGARPALAAQPLAVTRREPVCS